MFNNGHLNTCKFYWCESDYDRIDNRLKQNFQNDKDGLVKKNWKVVHYITDWYKFKNHEIYDKIKSTLSEEE